MVEFELRKDRYCGKIEVDGWIDRQTGMTDRCSSNRPTLCVRVR